jgi:hypothetical protein
LISHHLINNRCHHLLSFFHLVSLVSSF